MHAFARLALLLPSPPQPPAQPSLTRSRLLGPCLRCCSFLLALRRFLCANFFALSLRFLCAFFAQADERETYQRVNARDSEHNTPLLLACHAVGAGVGGMGMGDDGAPAQLNADAVRLVELLLNVDADPNLANARGETPLHALCSARVLTACSAQGVLTAACSPSPRAARGDNHRNRSDGSSSSSAAGPPSVSDALLGDLHDAVRLLLAKKANVDAQTTAPAARLTPLHMVVRLAYISFDLLVLSRFSTYSR